MKSGQGIWWIKTWERKFFSFFETFNIAHLDLFNRQGHIRNAYTTFSAKWRFWQIAKQLSYIIKWYENTSRGPFFNIVMITSQGYVNEVSQINKIKLNAGETNGRWLAKRLVIQTPNSISKSLKRPTKIISLRTLNFNNLFLVMCLKLWSN